MAAQRLSLRALRADGEIFESGKLKLWVQKYPDMCGRRLIDHIHILAIGPEVVCNGVQRMSRKQ